MTSGLKTKNVSLSEEWTEMLHARLPDGCTGFKANLQRFTSQPDQTAVGSQKAPVFMPSGKQLVATVEFTWFQSMTRMISR